MNEFTPRSFRSEGHHKGQSPEVESPLLVQVGMKASNIRWLTLALSCLTCLGIYFCNDLPQALQTIIMKELDIEVFDFNLLYSVYYFPNIILPFLGGLMIDQLGINVSYVIFGVSIVLGQAVATYGAFEHNLWIMLAGRCIIALGGDSIVVAKSAMIAKWFMGKELSFALGAGLCIARLGSSLCSFLSPKLYDWTGSLHVPFLLGTILCIVSCFAVFGLNLVDKKADAEHAELNPDEIKEEKIGLKSIMNLKLIYYLLLFNSVFLYGGFYCFANNVNDLMVKRFGFNPSSAGNLITIIYICPVIITPFCGTVADRYGKRVLIILIASFIFFLNHLGIAFLPDATEENPNYYMVIGLLGVGLFYAVYAAVFWPCIPIVVGQKLMGVGYGLAFSAENLMLALLPLALGMIHDNTIDFHQGYFWTQITLAVVVGIAVIITVWIYIMDRARGGKLDKPSAQAEAEAENEPLTKFGKQKSKVYSSMMSV